MIELSGLSVIAILIIFALFGLACFWSGAKIARKEPIIDRVVEEELSEPPDLMGKDIDGYEPEE